LLTSGSTEFQAAMAFSASGPTHPSLDSSLMLPQTLRPTQSLWAEQKQHLPTRCLPPQLLRAPTLPLAHPTTHTTPIRPHSSHSLLMKIRAPTSYRRARLEFLDSDLDRLREQPNGSTKIYCSTLLSTAQVST
jgi:hypothetical protein